MSGDYAWLTHASHAFHETLILSPQDPIKKGSQSMLEKYLAKIFLVAIILLLRENRREREIERES